MARISKYKLQSRVLDKLFILFFEIVGNKHNKEEFQKTLVDLLSPVERIMIAKRIAIVYLLLKKIDYLTICDVLKVSPGTIAKFSLLMEKSEGVVPTFKNVLRNEKIGEFLDDLFNNLFPPGRYGANWKAAWQRKFESERLKAEGV